MQKKLFHMIIILLFAFFCFSGCYQMGRAIGKAEKQVNKVERKIERAGKNFERGYEKEKSAD